MRRATILFKPSFWKEVIHETKEALRSERATRELMISTREIFGPRFASASNRNKVYAVESDVTRFVIERLVERNSGKDPEFIRDLAQVLSDDAIKLQEQFEKTGNERFRKESQFSIRIANALLETLKPNDQLHD